jgi:Flp pilus assembly protein TadG
MHGRTQRGRAGRRARGHRRTTGQATVEFALALPFVVVLMLALLQVALLARDQVRVTHASREAARAESVAPGGDRARDAVRHLLGGARLELSGGGAIGEPVTATVRYTAATDVPIVGVFFPDVELRDSTTIRAEQE